MKKVVLPVIFLVVLLLALAVAFKWFTTHYSEKGSEMLMEDISWSFAEPIPPSPEQMIKAVEKYHSTIGIAFNKRSLTAISPFSTLDLEYEYATQKPSGDWEHFPVVVRIGDGTRMLSYAEVLWQLHSNAHQHLRDQDSHYFEGLAPKEKTLNSGVATFEVYLGS